MKITSIRKIGKSKIIKENDNIYVIKSKEKELNKLFKYLDKKGFTNHPNIIEEDDKEIKYEYIEKDVIENSDEEIKIIANLHQKTTQNKKISKRKHKDIYEKLISNIDYLKEYYEKVIRSIDEKTYMSPEEYHLARNYTLIYNALLSSEKDTNTWYKQVQDKSTERVSIVHNNLKEDNFHKGEKTILLSWEKYIIDSPALELYKYLRNKSDNIANYLNEYNSINELSKEEKLLLKILLETPSKYEKTNNNIENIRLLKDIFNNLRNINKAIESGVFD